MSTAVSPAIRMQADRLKYAAMRMREILIWKNWLYSNSTRFDRYEYNVRLGDGVDPGSGYQDSARRMWIANSMARVDVIAVRGGHVTIIEVEEAPGMSATNQPLAYAALWRKRVQAGGPPMVHVQVGVEKFFPADLPPDPSPGLMIVCARASNDAMAVATAAGIEVDVVPTDFSSLKVQGK